MVYNRITVAFGALKKVTAPSISYQYDVTQILIIRGLNLPEYYVVDFCNDGDANVVPITGTAEGVEIPDSLLQTGKPIKAYIVVSSGQGDVQTRYEIKIPVNNRPLRSDIDPTEDQQLEIDSLIAALNDGVSRAEEASAHAPIIEARYWYVWDAETSGYVNTGIKAEAVDGVSPTVTVTDVTGGHRITIVDATGTHIFDVADGTDGDDGYSPAVTITNIEGGHRVNITDKDHPDGQNFDVMDGTSPENPVTSVNGKTGAVVLDSGDIAYESTTVEDELGTINSALTSLQSVTEIIDTASGAIASFPDGSGLPMRSLVAQINPVQDLHGQSSPYPPGGSAQMIPDGTNTNNGYEAGKILMEDGTFVNNSDAYISEYFPVTAGASYAYSAKETIFSPAVGFYDSNKSFISGVKPNGSNPKVMTAPTGAAYARASQYKPGYSNMTQLEAGTTATTIKPYSNICPISGWTGLSGQRTGFNVWDEEWELGVYDINTGAKVNNTSNIRSKNLISIKPNTSYCWVNDITTTVRIVYYDINKAYLSYIANTWTSPHVFTTPAKACYMAFYFGGTDYTNGFSINYPSADTSYHAYTGEAISVSFGQTVYGGTDEVIEGNGTSTMGMVALGDLTYSYDASNLRFYANLPSDASHPESGSDANGIISSQYVASLSGANGTMFRFYSAGAGARIFIIDGNYTDATAFKSALQANNAQLCYELATPQTFTHEGQSVDTLVGQNNVWVDTGDVSVTYQASIKGYIDKVLGA